MPRWVFSAALMTVAVAFSAAPATAGLFSRHCHTDHCAPTCGAPIDCYIEPSCGAPIHCAPVCEPSCGAPVHCAPAYGPSCAVPVGPSCAVPVYGGCGDVYCYDECERESCLRRCLRKLASCERRKNNRLRDLFCGHKDCEDVCYSECAPIEYYQPSCAAPCAPSCAAPGGFYH